MRSATITVLGIVLVLVGICIMVSARNSAVRYERHHLPAMNYGTNWTAGLR